MSNLVIYDSQGRDIGDEKPEQNERIEQFFFDQVRLAIDKSGIGCEIVCFFRARESSASRSEQYYAVFSSGTDWEQARHEFEPKLRQRVENEHDLSIVTTNKDTDVFRVVFDEDVSLPMPPRTERLDTALEMVEAEPVDNDETTDELGAGQQVRDPDGGRVGGSRPDREAPTPTDVNTQSINQAHLGVDSSRMATSVASYAIQSMDSLVISDDEPNSGYLTKYDFLIQTGTEERLKLLGGTKSAYERSQEKHQEPEPVVDDDSRNGPSYGGIGLLIFMLILVAAFSIFVACVLGAPLPDAIPGCGVVSDSGVVFVFS